MKNDFTVGKPSTAHYEGTTYVHDPINQLLAEQTKQGLTQPAPVPQAKHPFGKPGYCEAHLVLGCVECNR